MKYKYTILLLIYLATQASCEGYTFTVLSSKVLRVLPILVGNSDYKNTDVLYSKQYYYINAYVCIYIS